MIAYGSRFRATEVVMPDATRVHGWSIEGADPMVLYRTKE